MKKKKYWILYSLITMSFLSKLALIGFGVGVSAVFYGLGCMYRDELLPPVAKTEKRIRVSIAKMPEVIEPASAPVVLDTVDMEKNETVDCQINNIVPVLRNKMYKKIVVCEKTFYVFRNIPHRWYITIQGEHHNGKFINPSACHFRYHMDDDFNKSYEGLYYLSMMMSISSFVIFSILALWM